MTPPSNSHRHHPFRVQATSHAGRGVVAAHPLPAGAPLLHVPSPAIHVVFWQYRKEVCARCFHYDRGRTLPVRDAALGKVFCTANCQSAWSAAQGKLGLDAWTRLHAFSTSHSRHITNAHGHPSTESRPTPPLIADTWTAAALLTQSRAKRPARAPAAVDPDILGYLLSAALLHHGDPECWDSSVAALEADSTPYRSTADLLAHSTSFLQLHALLPEPLRASLTTAASALAIAVSSHNAFGLRSEDGEEYFGYALYPAASYFNHSCEPNVGKGRVGAGWEFWASGEVVEDAECCISYMGGDEREMGTRERRERLRECWGFVCGCARCVRDGAEGAEGEA